VQLNRHKTEADIESIDTCIFSSGVLTRCFTVASVASWCNGNVSVSLVTERSPDRLGPWALSGSNLGQVVHTLCLCSPSSIIWYSVPAKGRWCPAAGKVTVNLASHWPCVTDSVVYPPTGCTARFTFYHGRRKT